jgi:hypothetical protein
LINLDVCWELDDDDDDEEEEIGTDIGSADFSRLIELIEFSCWDFSSELLTLLGRFPPRITGAGADCCLWTLETTWLCAWPCCIICVTVWREKRSAVFEADNFDNDWGVVALPEAVDIDRGDFFEALVLRLETLLDERLETVVFERVGALAANDEDVVVVDDDDDDVDDDDDKENVFDETCDHNLSMSASWALNGVDAFCPFPPERASAAFTLSDKDA